MIAAQHIKDLRLEQNYSQSYLAHELNVSQKTYSNLENGKSRITISMLQKLSEIYRMEISDLIKKISLADTTTVNNIKEQHHELSEDEIYNGVNTQLPMELISHLKERIEDLKLLIEAKDELISTLKNEIGHLQNK